ncbi:MAG TPA: hypothetical protein VHC20_07410 [Candidatus Paceibacterota bacterium]|nr:hypothetical protein [Candidatus Paceibacterota bacterium]
MKTLHVVFIILTLLVVAYADEQALRYLFGKKQLNTNSLRVVHYLVASGLALTIITGGFLYLRAPALYLSDTTFIVKMVAVAALIINSAFLDRFSTDAATRTWDALSAGEKRMLLASGAVSILGWATAGICGLLLR